MKIKVDKEEWDKLLERVSALEESHRYTFEHNRYLSEHLQELMEDFFKKKCMTVMVKRDKNMILAEVRKNAMDNLFKDKE